MKIAVFFGNGYEEIEALSVIDVLRRGGVTVDMIGVDGEKESSARNISINMDRVITDVNIDEYDMLVLPGGIPGVHSLSACDKLTTALKKFKEEGKWLAAICLSLIHI